MSVSDLAYSADDHNSCIERFEEKGVIVIKRDPRASEVNPLLEGGCDVVKGILDEYINLANQCGGLGLRKEGGYRELVQKDVGRYDLNLDHLIPRSEAQTTRSLTDAETKMRNIFSYVEGRIKCVLPSILTDQYIVNAFGAVVSYPNTEAQRWHVDVSHLYQIPNNDTSSTLNNLPCHFVTVFCPLYEFSEEIGPTEIALSSKTLTASFGNKTVDDQYPPDDVVNSILRAPNIEVVKFQAEVGDIGIDGHD